MGTGTYPGSICLFKVNNENTRTMCDICSKSTIKTPERRQWRRSCVFAVKVERTSHLFLVIFIVDFEHLFVC